MNDLYLFNRVASVSIGPENGTGVLVSNLRIRFDIEKSIEPEKNKCKIVITNLSKETRSSFVKKDYVVILKAGYKDAYGEELIFAGYIEEYSVDHARPNVETTLYVKDGSKKLDEARFSISYDPGTTIKQVISDLSNRLKCPTKINISEISDKQYVNGLSFSGEARYLLNTICSDGDLEWSFQNNKLRIDTIKKKNIDAAISLDSSTGLIGSPERVLNILGKKDNDPEDKIPGWKVKSLLIPRSEPGDYIQLKSIEIPKPTAFKILEVTHNGDTHGAEWTTELKVQDIT